MANVIAQMLEHLSTVKEGKTTEDLLTEASEVQNQDERSAYIQTLFENFHLKQPPPPEPKDSQVFIEQGFYPQAKSAMETGDLEYALQCLNEGLTVVPEVDTQQLSSAYALRAEVLLRGRHFEACAADVARAASLAEKDADWDGGLSKILALSHKLSSGSEVDDKTEQETEAGDSGNAPETSKLDQKPVESRSEKAVVHKFYVEAPNPLVPCASEALTLSGMHFVATREIKPGEILMVEEPLVFIADHTHFDRCSYCLKTVVATLPCGGCCWVGLFKCISNKTHLLSNSFIIVYFIFVVKNIEKSLEH